MGHPRDIPLKLRRLRGPFDSLIAFGCSGQAKN